MDSARCGSCAGIPNAKRRSLCGPCADCAFQTETCASVLLNCLTCFIVCSAGICNGWCPTAISHSSKFEISFENVEQAGPGAHHGGAGGGPRRRVPFPGRLRTGGGPRVRLPNPLEWHQTGWVAPRNNAHQFARPCYVLPCYVTYSCVVLFFWKTINTLLTHHLVYPPFCVSFTYLT